MRIRKVFEDFDKYNYNLISTNLFLTDIRDTVKIVDSKTILFLQKNLFPFRSYDDGFRYKDCYQYLSWGVDVKFKIFSDNDEWYYIVVSRNPSSLLDKIYKCDQLDGLIECIEEEIIRNNED